MNNLSNCTIPQQPIGISAPPINQLPHQPVSIPPSQDESKGCKAIFEPQDNDEDCLVSRLLQAKILGPSLLLDPAYDQIGMCAISLKTKERILQLLEWKYRFLIKAPKNEFFVEVTIKEIYCFLLKKSMELKHPLEGLQIVGSMVPYLLGYEYYQEVLRDWLKDPSFVLTDAQINSFSFKPHDIDFRSWFTSCTNDTDNIANELFRLLVEDLAKRHPQPSFSDLEVMQLINQQIFPFVNSVLNAGLTQDQQHPNKTHYLLIDFAKSGEQNIEWLFVQSLERKGLFLQDLELNIGILLSDPKALIGPSGPFQKGYQAIADKVCKIIHIDKPKSVDKQGLIRYCAKTSQGYRCPDASILPILRKTTLDAVALSSLHPAEGLAKLLRDYVKHHNNECPKTLTVLLYNACLALEGDLDSETVKELWQQVPDFPPTKKPPNLVAKIAQTSSRDGIPFQILSALLEFMAFNALLTPNMQDPDGVCYYLTKHEEKPYMQLAWQGVTFLLPFRPERTLDLLGQIEKSWLGPLESLAQSLIPFYLFSSTKVPPVHQEASFLPLSIPLIKEKIFALLRTGSPLFFCLGYETLLALAEMDSSPDLYASIIKHFPKALCLYEKVEPRRILLQRIEGFILRTSASTLQLTRLSKTIENETIALSEIRHLWIKILAKTKNPSLCDTALNIWKKTFYEYPVSQQVLLAKSLIHSFLSENGNEAISVFEYLLMTNVITLEDEEDIVKLLSDRLSQEKKPLIRYQYIIRLKKTESLALPICYEWFIRDYINNGEWEIALELFKKGIKTGKLSIRNPSSSDFAMDFFLQGTFSPIQTQELFKTVRTAGLVLPFEKSEMAKQVLIAIYTFFIESDPPDDVELEEEIVSEINRINLEGEEKERVQHLLEKRQQALLAQGKINQALTNRKIRLADQLGTNKAVLFDHIVSMIDKNTVSPVHLATTLFLLGKASQILLSEEDTREGSMESLASLLTITLTLIRKEGVAALHKHALVENFYPFTEILRMGKQPKDILLFFETLLEATDKSALTNEQQGTILRILSTGLRSLVTKSDISSLESLMTSYQRSYPRRSSEHNRELSEIMLFLAQQNLLEQKLDQALVWMNELKVNLTCHKKHPQKAVYDVLSDCISQLCQQEREFEALALLEDFFRRNPRISGELLGILQRKPEKILTIGCEFCADLFLMPLKQFDHPVLIQKAKIIAEALLLKTKEKAFSKVSSLLRVYRIMDPKIWKTLLEKSITICSPKIKEEVFQNWLSFCKTKDLQGIVNKDFIKCWEYALDMVLSTKDYKPAEKSDLISLFSVLKCEGVEAATLIKITPRLLKWMGHSARNVNIVGKLLELPFSNRNPELLQFAVRINSVPVFTMAATLLLEYLQSEEILDKDQACQLCIAYLSKGDELVPKAPQEIKSLVLALIDRGNTILSAPNRIFSAFKALLKYKQEDITIQTGILILGFLRCKPKSQPGDKNAWNAGLEKLIISLSLSNRIEAPTLSEDLFSEAYRSGWLDSAQTAELAGTLILKRLNSVEGNITKESSLEVLNRCLSFYPLLKSCPKRTETCMTKFFIVLCKAFSVLQDKEMYQHIWTQLYSLAGNSKDNMFAIRTSFIKAVFQVDLEWNHGEIQLLTDAIENVMASFHAHSDKLEEILDLLESVAIRLCTIETFKESQDVRDTFTKAVVQIHDRGGFKKCPERFIVYCFLLPIEHKEDLITRKQTLKTCKMVEQFTIGLLKTKCYMGLHYALMILFNSQDRLLSHEPTILHRLYSDVFKLFPYGVFVVRNEEPLWKTIDDIFMPELTDASLLKLWIHTLADSLRQVTVAAEKNLLSWNLLTFTTEKVQQLANHEIVKTNPDEMHGLLEILLHSLGNLAEATKPEEKACQLAIFQTGNRIWDLLIKTRNSEKKPLFRLWVSSLLRSCHVGTVQFAFRKMSVLMDQSFKENCPPQEYYATLSEMMTKLCYLLSKEKKDGNSIDRVAGECCDILFRLILNPLCRETASNSEVLSENRSKTLILWLAELSKIQNENGVDKSIENVLVKYADVVKTNPNTK
jgi:hypothetical protein